MPQCDGRHLRHKSTPEYKAAWAEMESNLEKHVGSCNGNPANDALLEGDSESCVAWRVYRA